MTNAFGCIAPADTFLSTHTPWFIQRSYQTEDPWGKQLNLITAKHDGKYAYIEYNHEFHAASKAVDEKSQTTQK